MASEIIGAEMGSSSNIGTIGFGYSTRESEMEERAHAVAADVASKIPFNTLRVSGKTYATEVADAYLEVFRKLTAGKDPVVWLEADESGEVWLVYKNGKVNLHGILDLKDARLALYEFAKSQKT